MNVSSLDRVIERVAKENGYALQKDDLQMVLVTVMNQIIEDQRAGVAAALESYREVHQDIALRWQLDAGKATNKILGVALDAGRAEMAKAMSAGAAQVVRIVNEAADAALAKQRSGWGEDDPGIEGVHLSDGGGNNRPGDGVGADGVYGDAMTKTRSGKKAPHMKYDLRYYAECFARDMPPGRTLLHARTLDGALGVGEHRVAALVPDYGDVISRTIRVKIMTCANAARLLNISRGRLDQLRRKGRFGEVIRFSGRYFLLRASVEAFAERRRKCR